MMESRLQRIKEVEGQARGSRMTGMAGSAAAGMSIAREAGGAGIQADVGRLAEQFAYKTVAFYYRQGWR